VCKGVHFQMSNLLPNADANSPCGPDRVLLQIGPKAAHIRLFLQANKNAHRNGQCH